ncbi:cell division cycle 25 homolog d [Carcharodon carcharias]|uniref:cell division cycle 25 homolog d n=1 Tax=Carcharodon carcharias TaxID=13397 RepID=UPI001B7DFC2C|nr:cell division cycle 25 homolog d [Carcharodon carcharias]
MIHMLGDEWQESRVGAVEEDQSRIVQTEDSKVNEKLKRRESMSFSPDPPFYPHLHFSPVSSLSFNLNGLTCQESDTPKRRLKLSPESGNPSPEALPVATDTKTPTGQSPSSPCRLETTNTSKSHTPVRPTVPKPIRLLEKMRMKTEGNFHQLGKQYVYNLRRLSYPQEVDVKQIPDSEECSLIGDFSKACVLPVEEGKHQDLKYISARTVAALLGGEFEHVIDEYVIVDCRYPYEYNGGHIKGALNLYTEEQLINTFFPSQALPYPRKHWRVIIFHCEFSSERGPKFCRNLRRMDRNANVYPRLCFPELYILKDGYKEFFQEFETFCEPQGYIQMHHKDYREELRTIRRKVRSVAAYRRRKELFKTANGH